MPLNKQASPEQIQIQIQIQIQMRFIKKGNLHRTQNILTAYS